MLSFRHKKGTSKNVVDTTFKYMWLCPSTDKPEFIGLFCLNPEVQTSKLQETTVGAQSYVPHGSKTTLDSGVVVITNGQLHSTKPETRPCAGLNPAGSMSEICNSDNL